MGVNLGGVDCVDPATLYDECLEDGLPTADWLGKANSFRNPLGYNPGTGFLLLTRVGLNKLNLNSKYDLKFEIDGRSATFKSLLITNARCVTPGLRGDPSGTVLVEVADRRQHLARIPVDKGYNLWKTDGTAYYNATTSDGAGTAWTWQGMVNDLCGKLGIGNITLPYTPDATPANWSFYEDSAWRALNKIFAKLSVAVRWNAADTFDAVELGKADGAVTSALVVADSYRDWDYEPSGLTYSLVPPKISVPFTRYPQPTDGTSPYYVVDKDAPGTVTTPTATLAKTIAPDDLPALCDSSNAVTNSAACTTRATERATKFYQALTAWAVNPLGRRYVGILVGVAMQPGSLISHVACMDLGLGYRTEIARLEVPAVKVEFPPAATASSGGGGDQFCVVKDSGTAAADLRGTAKHLKYDADLPSPQWDGDDFQTATVSHIWLLDRRRAALAPGDRESCHQLGTFDPRTPIPPGTVTGATNATPIVVQTGASHTLSTGDTVTITGVLGNTAANGTFVITVTDATHFSLNGTTGSGAYTSGGTWVYVDTGKASDSRPLYGCRDPGLHIVKIGSDNPVDSTSGSVLTHYWTCQRMYRDQGDHTWKTRTGDFWITSFENKSNSFKNGWYALAHLVDEYAPTGTTKKAVYTALVTGISLPDLMKCINNVLFAQGGCLMDAGGEVHVLKNDGTEVSLPCSVLS